MPSWPTLPDWQTSEIPSLRCRLRLAEARLGLKRGLEERHGNGAFPNAAMFSQTLIIAYGGVMPNWPRPSGEANSALCRSDYTCRFQQQSPGVANAKYRPFLGGSSAAPAVGLGKKPFQSPQVSLRRCSANQLRRLGFTPPGSALPGRAPSTYHGLGNRLWQRGHFYFAGEGTFLFCLDTPIWRQAPPAASC